MSAPPLLRPLRAILQRRLQTLASPSIRTAYYPRAQRYPSHVRYNSSIPPDNTPPQAAATEASKDAQPQVEADTTTPSETPTEAAANAGPDVSAAASNDAPVPRLDTLISAFQKVQAADAEIRVGIAEAVERQLAAEVATATALASAVTGAAGSASGDDAPQVVLARDEGVPGATKEDAATSEFSEMAAAWERQAQQVDGGAEAVSRDDMAAKVVEEAKAESGSESTEADAPASAAAAEAEPVQQPEAVADVASEPAAETPATSPAAESTTFGDASAEEMAMMQAYFAQLRAKKAAEAAEAAPAQPAATPEPVVPEPAPAAPSAPDALSSMTAPVEPSGQEVDVAKVGSSETVQVTPDSQPLASEPVPTPEDEAVASVADLDYLLDGVSYGNETRKPAAKEESEVQETAADQTSPAGLTDKIGKLSSMLETEISPEEGIAAAQQQSAAAAATPEDAIAEEDYAAADEKATPEPSRMPRNVQALYLQPLRRVAEYNIPSCDLQLRSYSVRPLESFCDFALRAAYYLGLPAHGPVPLPKIIERWTVPKSSFIFKKSQENFERITRRRLIQIRDGHPETVQIWLAFLQKHQQAAVGMKANLWEFSSLDVAEQLQIAHKKAEKVIKNESRLLYQNKEFATVEKVDELLQSERYRLTGGQHQLR